MNLYGSFLGKPIIKLASTFYAVKVTAASFMNKGKKNQPASAEQKGKGE